MLSQNTETTIGVYVKFKDMARVCDESDFSYAVDATEYTLTICGEYHRLSIGDSVLIEYSIEDPSISRLKNPNNIKLISPDDD